MKIPGIFLCILLALTAVQAIYFIPRMPERMATQIDRSGHPRSWMDRSQFLIVYAGLATFLGAVFLLVPLSSDKAPGARNRQMPVPSSARPVRSMRAVKTAVMWAGAGTLAFLLGIGHFTFLANLGQSAQFRWRADLALACFGVFLAVWVVLFLRAFRTGSPPPRSGC